MPFDHGTGALAGRRHVNRTPSGRKAALGRSGRYRTVTSVRLGALGEAAVALLQAWNQLGEVDRPTDADHAIGENPMVVGVPIGIAEPPRRGDAKGVRHARNPPMPGAHPFRLSQFLV